MARRKMPEVNAGSMADIAFLLLIFFLVSTTMGSEKGITRVLPPLSSGEKAEGVQVKKRNLLVISLDPRDRVTVADEAVDVSQVGEKIREFILGSGTSEEFPEAETIDIDLIGDYSVSRGVVSIHSDRDASYSAYIGLQGEISRAFLDLRNEVSKRYFGKAFAQLDGRQREAVQIAVPQRISEAEAREEATGR